MKTKTFDLGCTDYRLTRRALLGTLGALGTLGTAYGTLLGLPVRDLLAYAGSSHQPTAEHVVLFWNGGGMSHLDTWDPKPGRPTQGEFSPIDTSVSGLQVTEIFPELAKQAKHFNLIRSIAGTQGDHGRATYHLQTSYNQSSNLQHPGLGSVVVHQKTNLGDLPAYVTISGLAPRAGYLGQKCEAYFVGRPGEKDPYLAFPEGISQVRGNRRLETLAKYNERFARQSGNPGLQATQTANEDAVRLMRSPALAAFELEQENAETIARYGQNEFGRACLLAKRLVRQGVRFVQINRGGFDTHSNNFPAMTDHGEIMDPALAALLADLASEGLLSKTLVLMLSEFGRTPKINNNAGRDHHAACFSCLIGGGGTHGGKVIGSSDADGYQPKDRPVQVADIHATVCHALGIDGNKEVMTPLQRPMKLVDNGKPVLELFS